MENQKMTMLKMDANRAAFCSSVDSKAYFDQLIKTKPAPRGTGLSILTDYFLFFLF